MDGALEKRSAQSLETTNVWDDIVDESIEELREK